MCWIIIRNVCIYIDKSQLTRCCLRWWGGQWSLCSTSVRRLWLHSRVTHVFVLIQASALFSLSLSLDISKSGAVLVAPKRWTYRRTSKSLGYSSKTSFPPVQPKHANRSRCVLCTWIQFWTFAITICANYNMFVNQSQIGDRILSVNNQDVRHATQEETIGLIKNAGCRIELVLQSFDGSVSVQCDCIFVWWSHS